MKVRLHRPHTHAGTHHVPGPKGLVIDVPELAADYIERVGAGQRVRAKPRRPVPGALTADELDEFHSGPAADPESDIPDPEQ